MNTFVAVVSVVIALVAAYACGTACESLAKAKGYDGYAFLFGFFLSIPALIYYAGLPVSAEKYKEMKDADREALAALIREIQSTKRDPVEAEVQCDTSNSVPEKAEQIPEPDQPQSGASNIARRIPDGEDVRGIPQCKCSECGTRQNADRALCWHCGKNFE